MLREEKAQEEFKLKKEKEEAARKRQEEEEVIYKLSVISGNKENLVITLFNIFCCSVPSFVGVDMSKNVSSFLYFILEEQN